jgi:hypothetical protein
MAVTLDPQAEQYLQVFQALTHAEREAVNQALQRVATVTASDPAADALAEALAGRSFSRQERIQLEVETLARHFQHRRQLLEAAFSAPQVATLLGTSRQTPHDRVKNHTLLAIKDNGKLAFPAWQFDPAGPEGVIDGLPQVLNALEMSDYAKLNWLTRANPYLDGCTPVEALKTGQKDRVIAKATAAGAGQWS